MTKPNHCIWPIRTHYTFVSTNDYIWRILTAADWFSGLQLLPSYIWSLDCVDQGEGEDIVEKSILLRLKYFVTSLDISGADVPTDVSQWHLKNLIRLWLCKILAAAADLQYYHLSLTVLIQFVNSSVYLGICENLQIWILMKVWQQYNYIHRETNVIIFFVAKFFYSSYENYN